MQGLHWFTDDHTLYVYVDFPIKQPFSSYDSDLQWLHYISDQSGVIIMDTKSLCN